MTGLRDRNRKPVWPACKRCGHAGPGEVCPDCFTCRACKPGCGECKPYRCTPIN